MDDNVEAIRSAPHGAYSSSCLAGLQGFHALDKPLSRPHYREIKAFLETNEVDFYRRETTPTRLLSFCVNSIAKNRSIFLFGSKLGFGRILDLAYTLRADLTVFMRSAITPPKVNRFG